MCVAANFRRDLYMLAKELASVDLSGTPTTKEVLGFQCKVVGDACTNIEDREGEKTMEIKTDQDIEEEDEVEDEINPNITYERKRVRHRARFVVNNIDQHGMLDFEEVSLKLAKAVNQMVDCSVKQQKEATSFFPILPDKKQQQK